MSLEVVRARAGQVDEVSRLLDGAAAWLHGRGLDQWPDRFAAGRLMEAIEQRSTYLVLDQGKSVGTITIDEQPDKEFWSEDECLKPSLYVRKLAIDRDYRGLGSRLLNWAGTRAYDRKLERLRLDAWKTNEGLRDYYLGQGFAHVRTVLLAHRNSGALFERPAYPKPAGLLPTAQVRASASSGLVLAGR
jgi:GNAT superfamily N-acetyltransferase